MTTNMGKLDRTLRTIAALAIAYAWWSGAITGTLAIVFAVVAAVLLLTSAIGNCPIYGPLGITTNGRRQ